MLSLTLNAAATEVPEGLASWGRWKFPVLFGVGFSLVQVALALARFGFSGPAGGAFRSLPELLQLLSGVLLFFLGGLLAGLLLQRFLKNATGRLRGALLVAAVIATPLAILMSLVGGLLGPPVVVLNATVPYLLLVGLPLLMVRIWQKVSRKRKVE